MCRWALRREKRLNRHRFFTRILFFPQNITELNGRVRTTSRWTSSLWTRSAWSRATATATCASARRTNATLPTSSSPPPPPPPTSSYSLSPPWSSTESPTRPSSPTVDVGKVRKSSDRTKFLLWKQSSLETDNHFEAGFFSFFLSTVFSVDHHFWSSQNETNENRKTSRLTSCNILEKVYFVCRFLFCDMSKSRDYFDLRNLFFLFSVPFCSSLWASLDKHGHWAKNG